MCKTQHKEAPIWILTLNVQVEGSLTPIWQLSPQTKVGVTRFLQPKKRRKKLLPYFILDNFHIFYFPSQGQGEEGQPILEHLLKYALFFKASLISVICNV